MTPPLGDPRTSRVHVHKLYYGVSLIIEQSSKRRYTYGIGKKNVEKKEREDEKQEQVWGRSSRVRDPFLYYYIMRVAVAAIFPKRGVCCLARIR